MNPPPPPPPPSQPPRPPTPKKEVQLQGPRPSPLRVSKESVKIKKPPLHPHMHPHPHPNYQNYQNYPNNPNSQQHQVLEPVVIYTVSPKVIHATESDFMSIVQRLTGPSSPPSDDISPAARLASIHKTSPSSTSDHNNIPYDDDFIASIFNLEFEDPQAGGGGGGGSNLIDEMGLFPGILSPAPATLPPIPNGFFSHQHDVISSPMFNWHGIGVPSPSSALFAAPLVSPSPSSWDLFNNFLSDNF